ncbi:MAG: HAD-IA family hydrolase [Lachnospiraceae bacterium]|nr:HAD-IA family hydrolase [Lachnospiraceae bacterium]
MNNKYQIEIDEFAEKFAKYKEKKIVLYGVGRYTATLLEGLKNFHFIGLMDKDPANIGKTMFGLPVVDIRTAERSADIIVINTSETYWDVIYNRIQDINIPVFYKNGQKAEKKDKIEHENPFRDLSYDKLCQEMEAADMISFDFFDTLFMRSICNPPDIFRLLEIWVNNESMSGKKFPFELMRYRGLAKEKISENYSLDELYEQIQKISGADSVWLETVKNKELKLEMEQLVPRDEVFFLLQYAQKMGKEIYIISDMYLPETFYKDIFKRHEITIPTGHILLSNELGRMKVDGTMWEYYAKNIVKGRSALHIGDHWKADIEEPSKYGLKTYLAPSVWDMLQASSMREAAAHICSDYDTAIMGCIVKKLFHNPYELKGTDGTIQIQNNYDMGYCVFGPVILTFLYWLLQKSSEDKVSKLVFMSRDGYFLKEDFDYLCKVSGKKQEHCYLGISRQLAMTASIVSWTELMEYARMPYSNRISELFEDRFDICGIEEIQGRTLEEYIEDYQQEIEKYVHGVRENYLHYIEQMNLDDACAIVDLGYYGNNQKYLNQLLHKKLSGYYFNVNLSKQNQNTESQSMVGCFQKKEDVTGENSQILKKMIFLESFLTAPYGMVKAVDKEGNFICAEKKKNQEYFQDKIEINQGVKQFIYDYWKAFGEFSISPNCEFIDWYYGYCFSGAVEFTEDIKRSFYNDNAMMNRIESMLFY